MPNEQLLPPDQEPASNGEGTKEVFEDGLIPVDEPVPPEVIAAQERAATDEASVAEGIKNVTDTSLTNIASSVITCKPLN